ncbi:hypothetical protein AEM51_02310 [Bacteroidetes bacterium UKL13-3]|nr:hypothetical protein AEM51_02310 [Bacteroidetes bacterium UKL13-3]HCP93164.1 hypothetical protein [Bacteroidota bacterium]
MKPTNIELIESFAQGKVNLPPPMGTVGNCASIALIKASIEVFGLNNVFKLEKTGDTYQVTFKNSKKVTFTEKELARSNEVAGFVLNTKNPSKLELYTSIRDYALIALCSMVKRVMEIGEVGEGKGDFEKALRALNDGANSPSLPEKLGLEEYSYRKSWFSGASAKGTFGWLKAHTVFISQGVRDDYGKVSSDTWRYPSKIQIVEDKI